MNRNCPVVAGAGPGRSAWVGPTAPVLLAALFFTAGCRQPVEPNRPAGGIKRDEAAAILVRMRDAYHTAEAYSDQGVMRLSYHEQGRPWTDEAPFAVRLKRPQQIRVRAYNTMIWCDGQQLVAHRRQTDIEPRWASTRPRVSRCTEPERAVPRSGAA